MNANFLFSPPQTTTSICSIQISTGATVGDHGKVTRSRPRHLADIQLTAQEFSVVAHIISADHDMIVGENIPYDDGWNQETKEMEESAQQHMEEETSDEEIETEDAIVC